MAWLAGIKLGFVMKERTKAIGEIKTRVAANGNSMITSTVA